MEGLCHNGLSLFLQSLSFSLILIGGLVQVVFLFLCKDFFAEITKLCSIQKK